MRTVLGLAAALLLSACGGDQRTQAANDVHDLLVAAQSGDAAGFEAGIDRDKLKANLRAQVIQHAKSQGIDISGPSEAALDRMIGPDALRVARAGGAPPTAAEIATALKVEEGARACLPGPAADCALSFEKQGQRWKLIDVRTSAIHLKAGEG